MKQKLAALFMLLSFMSADCSEANERVLPYAATAELSGCESMTDCMPAEPVMVSLSGGCFQMGSDTGADDEKPVHEVCLDPFRIGKYEITQREWQSIMGVNPSRFTECGLDCPVDSISWNDLQLFVQRLNRSTGKSYRLPTEAEWEYAARLGEAVEPVGMNQTGELARFAWSETNSGRMMHRTGLLTAHPSGAHDMLGNAWEWCSDWYADDYYVRSPRLNPTGPEKGQERVIRGGSWISPAEDLHPTRRSSFYPWARYPFNGGRLVLAMPVP